MEVDYVRIYERLATPVQAQGKESANYSGLGK
jgi:hypothetical protein